MLDPMVQEFKERCPVHPSGVLVIVLIRRELCTRSTTELKNVFGNLSHTAKFLSAIGVCP